MITLLDVSIIMPVYNAGAYLTRALDSIVAQTFDHAKMELIVIDDGSTDGSGEALDCYAELHSFMKVIHQRNSGTPAAPRNRGLGAAQGEYVFFCDSDDYLGEEAVERMLAHAREWNSDVLLAKLVGVGGRKAPGSMFHENQPNADLYTSRVTWTLGPWKLFRRSMLEEFNMRFPEDSLSEDIPFVLNAYFHAEVISVAADYDYYFYAHRDDGQNLTLTSTMRKIELRVRGVERVFDLIERFSDDERRDPVLMLRLFRDEVAGALALVPSCPPEDQDRWFQRIRDCVLPFYNPGSSNKLPMETHLLLNAMAQNSLQLVAEIVELGPDVMAHVELSSEERRTYCTYTSSAEPALSVAADVTDLLPVIDYVLKGIDWGARELSLSGTLTVAGMLEGVPSVSLAVQNHPRDAECFSFPVQITPRPTTAISGKGMPTREFEWEGVADLTALRAPGFPSDLPMAEALTVSGPESLSATTPAIGAASSERWDFYLAVTVQDATRRVRLGANRDEGVFQSFFGQSADAGSRLFSPYETGYRNFSLLEMDADTAFSQLGTKPFELNWSDRRKARLRLRGELGDKKRPPGMRLFVVLRRADHGPAEEGNLVRSGAAAGSQCASCL